MYQRKDIPRYRRPGSRVMLFDQDELETWLKQGRIGGFEELSIKQSKPIDGHQAAEDGAGIVDISVKPVYHRRAQYR